MSTATIKHRLLDDKKWYESMLSHLAENATVDPQSNYAFRMAQEKLVLIDWALKRIAAGTLGYCDTCGGRIEPERLEILLDSDCHQCAVCVSLCKAPMRLRTRVETIAYQQRSAALLQSLACGVS